MPWDHCGLQVLDDQLCPTCGTRKPSWTTRLDRTRRLVLTRESDNGDQIETLEDAADVGSPFCEECQEQDEEEDEGEGKEEASEAEASEAETSEAEPEPEPDVDAQVDSLETASDSGAPFCEECQEQDAEDEDEGEGDA